jgi:hypothetical protein
MPPTRALSRLHSGGHGGRAKLDAVPWRLQYKRNNTKDCVSEDDSDDESISLGSPLPPSTERNASDDCHVLIRWSELQKLVEKRMSCADCGLAVTSFERRTIEIATEIDFVCSACEVFETAQALRSDYVVEESSMETNAYKTPNPKERVDYYDLNWRLIMATELLGESQVGGSIIGLMLDLTTDAFRNRWTKMELKLGEEQAEIGKIIVAWNLKKETIGKVAVLCDGVAKYPCSVSYDMEWQKASKTYDSLSGQGLMIGYRTKRVVAVQNYSKVCNICQRHSKAMETYYETPDIPVREHNCPKNHEGSSKGMEAKAALECVNRVWSQSEMRAFIEIICIDDDASTRAYLSHSFADLYELLLPRPTTKGGVPKTAKRDDKGRLPRNHPVIVFLADLCHRVRTFGKHLWRLKKWRKEEKRNQCGRLLATETELRLVAVFR